MAAAVAASVGCSTNVPPPTEVQAEASLVQFGGAQACQDLEKYIEDTAVLQMRTQIEGERDGVPSWGWWGGGLFFGRTDVLAPEAAGATNDAAKSAPTDYTTTNNQVAGVDEADFIKMMAPEFSFSRAISSTPARVGRRLICRCRASSTSKATRAKCS